MEYKRVKLIIITVVTVVLFVFVAALSYSMGYKKTKKIAVDFSVKEFEKVEREPKYKMMPANLSNYICDMADELKMDPDLIVAILMVENPEFNPDAISRPNENGTLDLGMFQLNDRYLWTEFKNDYWFENIELNPFNWKHNTYIALHHLKYLQDKFKIQDDVILAYNGGKGAVMNGTVKPSTYNYLRKVQNNLILLKGEKE